MCAAAARIFGFVDATLAKHQIPQKYGLVEEYDRALDVLRAAIGAEELTRLMLAGATMNEEEAIQQAHAFD